MDLQSITVHFSPEEKVNVLFEGTLYDLTFNASFSDLKTNLEGLYETEFTVVTIQLTEDQYGLGAESRLVLIKANGQTEIINLAVLSSEQPTFYTNLQAARVILENELTNILNA